MNLTNIRELADFNSEVACGIMHTPEWIERMAVMQRKFNLETYGVEQPEPGRLYARPSRKASGSRNENG